MRTLRWATAAAVLLLAASLTALPAAPAAAQVAKLPPVDEAAKDASWVAFRARLLKALAARDAKFLLSVLDRNVRNSFDAPEGVAEFRRQWDLDAEDSPLWRELSAALFLGSAYVKSEKGPMRVCAPYVLPRWPDSVDPAGYGAILIKDALVKSEPAAQSRTVITLSHDIVGVADWDVADANPDTKQRWVKLRLKAGDGYVPEEHIRSPIEHTACFVRSQNGWRLTALVAGAE